MKEISSFFYCFVFCRGVEVWASRSCLPTCRVITAIALVEKGASQLAVVSKSTDPVRIV